MGPENLLFALIIFGVGLVVLVHVSQTIRRAGQTARDRSTAQTLIIGPWAWAGIATCYSLLIGDSYLYFLPAFVIPLVCLILLSRSRSVSLLLRHISIHGLVGVQVYRVAGSVFLVSHFWFNSYLSQEFALRAGWGDILTGILAVPVAVAAWQRIRFWQIAVIGW
ncbi:MAG: hypothetical protein MJH10_19640 [Epibacterium sp.]|nr:hypothetical protein [Epibacterium sp.]NQX75696.1 hypothetical protein [Epibacterium sp.]